MNNRAAGFLLLIMIFSGAFYLSQRAPLGDGPASLRAIASDLETRTAAPQLAATEQARATQRAFDQAIYADALTATAGADAALFQQAQTATARAETATIRAGLTRQAEATQQALGTATAGAQATAVALTQTAEFIRAGAEAARIRELNRLVYAFAGAALLAVVFLGGVILFREYLDDRRTHRTLASIRGRILRREGGSPLFVTADERVIDPDRAFYPDAMKPAPNDDTQERVTHRAQTVQLAREFGKALAAAPGSGTEKYLAALAAGAAPGQAQLPPHVTVLESRPDYAEEVETKLIEEL